MVYSPYQASITPGGKSSRRRKTAAPKSTGAVAGAVMTSPSSTRWWSNSVPSPAGVAAPAEVMSAPAFSSCSVTDSMSEFHASSNFATPSPESRMRASIDLRPLQRWGVNASAVVDGPAVASGARPDP